MTIKRALAPANFLPKYENKDAVRNDISFKILEYGFWLWWKFAEFYNCKIMFYQIFI